jgi:hypothetical protein
MVQLRLQGNAFFSMIGIVAGAVIKFAPAPLFILSSTWDFRRRTHRRKPARLFLSAPVGCTKGGGVRIRIRDFSLGWFWHKEMSGAAFPPSPDRPA